MNIVNHIEEIRKDGITFIPKFISKKHCDLYQKKSLKVISMYKNYGKKLISAHNTETIEKLIKPLD